MSPRSLPILLAALLAAPAGAGDLALAVRSGGSSTVAVAPGTALSYEVVGELSDAANEGLAMVAFDLAFEGGSLAQALAPSAAPMTHFAPPLGLSNPAGFGGTPSSGALLQVGGAQNTIASSFAPVPIGAVVTGVCQPGSPAVLAAGTAIAPATVGTFVLELSNGRANVIRQGETGAPFWRAEPAGIGPVTQLTVEVVALAASAPAVSVSAGGSVALAIDAGAAHAGQVYLLLGSVSGTAPGLTLAPGLVLPLNAPDPYLDFTILHPNTPPLTHSLGLLDAQGRATAHFAVPPGSASALAGLVASHAFVTLLPLDFASNAAEIALVP